MPTSIRPAWSSRHGDRLAREHMERLGYSVLATNYPTRFGALDLVAHNSSAVVFVRVRTRRTRDDARFPAIGAAEGRATRRMAAAWLQENRERPRAAEIRFDAIDVVVDSRGRLVQLDHLEAGF